MCVFVLCLWVWVIVCESVCMLFCEHALYLLLKRCIFLTQPLGTSEILHLLGDCLLFSHACNFSNEKGTKMWRGKYPTRMYDLIWHNISVIETIYFSRNGTFVYSLCRYDNAVQSEVSIDISTSLEKWREKKKIGSIIFHWHLRDSHNLMQTFQDMHGNEQWNMNHHTAERNVF